jgi:hypothetical protein
MAANIIETPIEIFNDILKESTPSERKKNNLCIRIIKRKFKCILLALMLLVLISQIINTILPSQTPVNINLDLIKSLNDYFSPLNKTNNTNILT